MIIAASPPGLPRRSMTMPSARAEVDPWRAGTRVDRRHPDVEPDHARRAPPAGVRRCSDSTRTYMRRQVADRHRLPALRPPRHRDRRPASPRAVLERERGRSILRVRAAGSRSRATPRRVGSRSGVAGSSASDDLRHRARRRPTSSCHPVRTPALARTARRDRPTSPGCRGRRAGHRSRDRRCRPPARSRGESAEDGSSAKCDCPSRPSMSRITPRSSPGRRRHGARGRSSVRTAFQSTPFILGSKCVSRTIFHAASNVSTPEPGPAPRISERRERASQRARGERPARSLQSALIARRRRRTSAGSTLSYSTDVSVMTCCSAHRRGLDRSSAWSSGPNSR